MNSLSLSSLTVRTNATANLSRASTTKVQSRATLKRPTRQQTQRTESALPWQPQASMSDRCRVPSQPPVIRPRTDRLSERRIINSVRPTFGNRLEEKFVPRCSDKSRWQPESNSRHKRHRSQAPRRRIWHNFLPCVATAVTLRDGRNRNSSAVRRRQEETRPHDFELGGNPSECQPAAWRTDRKTDAVDIEAPPT